MCNTDNQTAIWFLQNITLLVVKKKTYALQVKLLRLLNRLVNCMKYLVKEYISFSQNDLTSGYYCNRNNRCRYNNPFTNVSI